MLTPGSVTVDELLCLFRELVDQDCSFLRLSRIEYVGSNIRDLTRKLEISNTGGGFCYEAFSFTWLST